MAYILYHGDCYDGFGAAWAYWKAFNGVSADQYISCKHGQPMPDIPDQQQVYILDFSFPEEALRSLAKRSYTVTLLDHHKTAEKDLQGLLSRSEPNMDVVFDMAKSGARLAWERFCGGDVPQLIQYIEDRDLWTNKLPHIEEITAWIRSYERTFENFDILHDGLNHRENRYEVIAQGAAILRFQRQKVQEICDAGTRMLVIGGYTVPVVNVPYIFASDVGHELLQRYPEVKFAAYYFDRSDGIRQWGLRSRKDFDCSVVAKANGGGGHAQASGFQEAIPCQI